MTARTSSKGPGRGAMSGTRDPAGETLSADARQGAVLTALLQRLTAASEVLLGVRPARQGTPAEDAARLLGLLLERLDGDDDLASMWLVLTALSASFPTPDELVHAVRHLREAGPIRALGELLRLGYRRALDSGEPQLEMDVVSGAVVVDVDFCATSDLHTGIQRVVRETVPRWERDHEMILVGWTTNHGAFRGLETSETHRVLQWGVPHEPDRAPTTTAKRMVVPWRCAVILPESPPPQRCALLACLAQHSGNTVSVIGYDCIPVISPELIHPGLPDRFVRYLTVMKHVHTIAGISASAATEFEGFARMVSAQGMTPPRVTECVLPVEVPPARGPRPVTELPLVMAVGSFEPRKNQVAVLHAAERLWREGLRFEILFVGGGGYPTEFDDLCRRLAHEGRPITVRTAVADDELWQSYRAARFTVFVSLHEGFGLPVAESLALGTPALTTNFGSTSEIAQSGGALQVDPRDDDAVMAAMRSLLEDDDLIAQLRSEAAARPVRTWDDYAAEAWGHLVNHSSGGHL